MRYAKVTPEQYEEIDLDEEVKTKLRLVQKEDGDDEDQRDSSSPSDTIDYIVTGTTDVEGIQLGLKVRDRPWGQKIGLLNEGDRVRARAADGVVRRAGYYWRPVVKLREDGQEGDLRGFVASLYLRRCDD